LSSAGMLTLSLFLSLLSYCHCYSAEQQPHNNGRVVTLSHVHAISVLVSILTNRLPVPIQGPAFPSPITFSHYWHQFSCSQPRRSTHACDPGGALHLQVVCV